MITTAGQAFALTPQGRIEKISNAGIAKEHAMKESANRKIEGIVEDAFTGLAEAAAWTITGV
ncbi:hypothetical protein [Streptomyces vinaceus]|uniref:hypothetical protein n=1 Tax=Streptomyces vinaceus TaxID=1960 RepID=UPI003809621C